MAHIARWVFGIALLAVLGILAWALVTTPVTNTPKKLVVVSVPTTTTPTPTPQPIPMPLSSKVSVTQPLANATVSKSFAIKGKAPGSWYFEASFPIQVRDKNGSVIGRAQGKAQGDWMTTALVPFSANITLDTNYTGPATLILLRDNPSGLPENDDSVVIDITIK